MIKISPHLSIYKFPITAISSITNRVSGMYITGIGLASSFFYLTNENTKNSLQTYYYNSNYYSKKVLNYIFLYPFGYHFCGGIRHLIWDSYPQLLTNSGVAKSSKLLFAVSILPTIALENKLSEKFN
tara:strand:- start:2176 stop:2556 length:381 start_codon:yes stop_codon:yes gene_type:complete